MSHSLDPLRARGPLAWTFTVVAVTGLFALGLVDYLARNVARPARLAGIAEPEVTGSIGPSGASALAQGGRAKGNLADGLRSVVLDPCTGRERLLVRGP